MKKLASLLLILSMLFFTFIGCQPARDTDETMSATTTADGEIAAPPEDLALSIAVADLAKYKVIRPENAGNDILKATTTIISAIKEAYGVELTPRDDFFRDDIPTLAKGELEILLGNTNREESQSFLSELKRDDYGYRIIGKKLVIAGRTEEGTVAAIEKFVADVLSAKGEVNFFTNQSSFLHKGTYKISSLKLEGVEIEKYRLVYPYGAKLGEKLAAERIRDQVAELCGVYLEIFNDRDVEIGEHEIIIGGSSHVSDSLKSALPELAPNTYYVGMENGIVWISAVDTIGHVTGAGAVCDAITPDAEQTEIDGKLVLGVSEGSVGDVMTVMSFNVWVSEKTAARSKAVTDMILKYMPDTFGVQEASPDWMKTLKSALGELYDCAGVGRNGGNSGEYSAVFYLKEKFTLKESSTKWLSDSPDVEGSRFESSSLPRIMTYVLLERKSDGKTFAHVNTHLHHTSDATARNKQSAVLMELIKPLIEKYPIILTGDFNDTSSSTVYKNVINGGLKNAADMADKSEKEATFPGSNKIIDFIFVSNTGMIVDTYQVCEEQINGITPSDHRPIVAKYYMY